VARIRTIKPQLWGSGDVTPLSRDARLLFVGLISMADDDGRFLAAINAINGYVFPNDELAPSQVRKWMKEIVTTGAIHLYTVDGITYGCIPNWHKHQVINRHTPSPLPNPDIECFPRSSFKTHGALTEDSVSAHVPTHDRKGREGKGREGKSLKLK
jgi:hypothetical protein